jgi:hypothetical protein
MDCSAIKQMNEQWTLGNSANNFMDFVVTYKKRLSIHCGLCLLQVKKVKGAWEYVVEKRGVLSLILQGYVYTSASCNRPT